MVPGASWLKGIFRANLTSFGFSPIGLYSWGAWIVGGLALLEEFTPPTL